MFRFMRARLVLASVLFAVACGGKTTVTAEPPDGATDSASDTSVVDGRIDGVVPIDVIVPGDVIVPVDVIVPDGPPPDTGTPLTDKCAAAGGVACTPARWMLCPAGYEPIGGADGHLGCGPMGGWCCVVAPPSTCSSSGKGNCVPGACTGCWSLVAGLTCESGRSCCQDMCD
jgi:hypothetical protein